MKRRDLLQAAGTLAVAGIGIRSWERVPVLARNAESTKRMTVVAQWNDLLLQLVRKNRWGPSITARALAIVHTAMYEAWAPFDGHAVGVYLEKILRRPHAEQTPAAKHKAISYAAYRTLLDLFPKDSVALEDFVRTLGYDPGDAGLSPQSPGGIGNLAAQAVLFFRHKDGSNQLGDLHHGPYSDYTGYKPQNTPDQLAAPEHWQPLRVPDGRGGFVVQSYTTPHWGRVEPFALKSGSQFRPTLHLPHASSQAYLEQAEQILTYSAKLGDEEKTIADYWRDGPGSEQPPGHWFRIAQYLSQRDQHTLDQDVKLFFMLGNALLDASIACWDCKRAFDSVRPVSAIHYLFATKRVQAWAGPGQGTRWITGKDWQPYQPLTVVTPPFPEYCSGHSTFSAASAEILRRFSGSDKFGASFTRPAGTSPIEPYKTPAHDVTLSWATFSEAAEQAGLSRRYGGIHFTQGDLNGRALGRSVGELVWNKAMTYVTGNF